MRLAKVSPDCRNFAPLHPITNMNQPADSSSTNADAGAGALIFVVDDEATIGEMISEVLTSVGHRVVVFTEPAETLAAFLRADPKPVLVMSDYVMSGMDGLKLIGLLKAAQPGLRTILFSGYMRGPFLQGEGEQADAFLTKPFMAAQLCATVAQVLKP